MKQQPEDQQCLPLEQEVQVLSLPDKDAGRSEVYAYAEQRFNGNKQRAESFVRGWFMMGTRFRQKP